MEKTGVVFEMTETFTLENMFAMELHKHKDVLNEIVTSAIKEIAIEKVGLFLIMKQLNSWEKKENFFFIQRENLFAVVPVLFEEEGIIGSRNRISALVKCFRFLIAVSLSTYLFIYLGLLSF